MPDSPPPLHFIDRFVLLLATGFGLGHLPKAPGTWGSLAGLILVWLLRFGPVEVYWIGECICVFTGVWICTRACDLLHAKDPGKVVWDEICAFPIVFMGTVLNPLTAFLGFVLFRLFDIAKPFPVKQFERLPQGWGVMADDLMAGLYAAGVLQILVWILTSMKLGIL